jgi:hypothetical protein
MLVYIKWIPLITKKKMWNCIFDVYLLPYTMPVRWNVMGGRHGFEIPLAARGRRGLGWKWPIRRQNGDVIRCIQLPEASWPYFEFHNYNPYIKTEQLRLQDFRWHGRLQSTQIHIEFCQQPIDQFRSRQRTDYWREWAKWNHDHQSFSLWRRPHMCISL